MRTLGGEVVGARWGWSSSGGGLSEAFAAGGVAVLVCRTTVILAGGLVQFFGDDLVAEPDALVADLRVTRRCHRRDLVASLAAEAAPFSAVRITHLRDGGDGRAGRLARGGQDRVHAADALVADVYARPGDQLLDLLLVLPAERA